MKWPDWWDWELEITPHIEKRMIQRNFTETDLRDMMEQAKLYRADDVKGRWVIETRYLNRDWKIIVEPDIEKLLLLPISFRRRL